MSGPPPQRHDPTTTIESDDDDDDSSKAVAAPKRPTLVTTTSSNNSERKDANDISSAPSSTAPSSDPSADDLLDKVGTGADSLSIQSSAFDALERDFKEVLSTLVGDKSLERFRMEYERLHSTLKKSHDNEKRLINKCRELNKVAESHHSPLSVLTMNGAMMMMMAMMMTITITGNSSECSQDSNSASIIITGSTKYIDVKSSD
jgi:hypothetical protein